MFYLLCFVPFEILDIYLIFTFALSSFNLFLWETSPFLFCFGFLNPMFDDMEVQNQHISSFNMIMVSMFNLFSDPCTRFIMFHGMHSQQLNKVQRALAILES
eukprot:542682_1